MTLHIQSLGLAGSSDISRTRPMTRPSANARPSVPGLHSGKVRRQVISGSGVVMDYVRVNKRRAAEAALKVERDFTGRALAPAQHEKARGSGRALSRLSYGGDVPEPMRPTRLQPGE